MRRPPLDEGRRWLDQAGEDLRWAGFLAQEGGYHLACFLSQQVAEMALKGFLYAQGEEVVLGHSVERLCAAAAGYLGDFQEKGRRWSLLDSYYVAARYPNSLPDSIPARVFTQQAAGDAVRLAEEAVQYVKGLLEPGATRRDA